MRIQRPTLVAAAALTLALTACDDDPGTLVATPAPVDFGPVLIGTTSGMPVDVTARGGYVTFAAPGNMAGPNASEFGDGGGVTGEIKSAEHQTVWFSFSPTAAGARSADYYFSFFAGSPDATANPLIIQGRGVRVLEQGDLGFVGGMPSGPHDFGAVCIGQHADWVLNVTNKSSRRQELYFHFRVVNPRFTLVAGTPNQLVPAGGQGSWTIRFTPVAIPPENGSVLVQYHLSHANRVGRLMTGAGRDC